VTFKTIQASVLTAGLAAVVALLVADTVATAAPTQWRTEDGGNGHWYEEVSVPGGITWADANAAATATGRYLATITSEAENSFVYDLARIRSELWHVGSGRTSGPWLGGYQSPDDGAPNENWHWVTGEPWGYTNWLVGEPNDFAPNENRLQFFGYTPPETSPQWNDTHDNRSSIWNSGYIVETPEPTTLSLLALGGLATILRMRGRNQKMTHRRFRTHLVGLVAAALLAAGLTSQAGAAPVTVYSFLELFQQEFPLASYQPIYTDEGCFSLFGDNNTTIPTTTLLFNATWDPAGYVNSYNMGGGARLSGNYIDKHAFWGLGPAERPVDAVTIVKTDWADPIGTYDTDTVTFVYTSNGGRNSLIYGAENYIIDGVAGNFAGFPDYQNGGDIGTVNITPEPATLSLLALGGLALFRRRSASV